ncbi:DUF3455 domain-containing protein [Collimonas humicola]|uniref:DUF3455 domain-containing protein n=1 Tax=Collimonas humicola TaxID=2825886 RepID=UPI001B8D0929|nr:DUF3455 domain-containing protein [Collimonas humicola]
MLKKVLSAAVLAGCAPFLAGCASTPALAPIAVPDNLQVASTQVLTLEAKATGVQIYQCAAAAADASKFEWHFVAPQAELYDQHDNKIGKHYAGPTWESNDGSKVVGAVQAQSKAPDADAIAWLLLNAKSTSGSGVFSRTQSIQRLQTLGGAAPADGCDQARLGQQTRVPYQAIYRFYSARS